jgi:cell division protein FtsA
MEEDETIVGLDIGTTKVEAIIAQNLGEGEFNVIGVGTSPSEGLKKGVVVNLEKTVNSITKAVRDAELMAGVKASSAYAGIAGDHIRSLNSRGVIAISGPHNEITKRDVERVIDAAKAVAIPMDREVLHVLPLEFWVDDLPGIKDPVGMMGVRLEVEVHIVTGAVTSAQNIYRSVKRADLGVNDLVLQPLASSYAVLIPDEKKLGVVLLDIGGGTADIAIFYDGSIRHTAVVGWGGENITKDIAIGLRTPLEQAERIKINYGCALPSMVEPDETIDVPGVGGRESRSVSRRILAQIIEPRVEEIFTMALREMRRSDFADLLAAGVVLTGGASMMEGMAELAEQIFDMPAKVGTPITPKGLTDLVSSPIHATGLGLIKYTLESPKGRRRSRLTNGGLFDKILKIMKGWFKDFF